MAICSNGAFVCLLISETINSNNFIWFLKILNQWLLSNNNFGYEDTLILIDNASIHKSKETKTILDKVCWKIIYLSVYSTDFAPIEMCFSILKNNLSKVYKIERINISQKNNYKIMRDSLAILKSETIKRMFGRLLQNIRKYIGIK